MALFTAIGTALGFSAVAVAGSVSAATAVGVGVSAMAAGAVATSMYSSNQQKKAYRDAGNMTMPSSPTAPVAPVKADAEKIAQAKTKEKRRAIARNASVRTNPLGIKDEAEVARKKLLGQ